MNWSEMLEALAPNGIVLMATATTGLKPGEDELLAVAAKLIQPNETHRDSLLLRSVDKDKIEATQEYHGISEWRVRMDGLSDEAFKAKLAELLDNRLVLTYNLPFQSAFLNDWGTQWVLASMPLLAATADMHMVLDEKTTESLADLLVWCGKAYGRDPTFKSMCRKYNYGEWDKVLTAPEFSVSLLYRMWHRLMESPAAVQVELF